MAGMEPTRIAVRRERTSDAAAVRSVVEAAFGRSSEADLVEALHRERAVIAAFVAVVDERIVGHALFSRVLIEAADASHAAAALAPLSVCPDAQRQGVGTRLVHAGLESLTARGEQSVLVLGDPQYYGRFGFSVQQASGLGTPFPPEAFMAVELVPGALTGLRGRVKYPPAFAV
jgi:putative acetyltransferase